MSNFEPAIDIKDGRIEATCEWTCPVRGCNWSHDFVFEGMKASELAELSCRGAVEFMMPPDLTAKTKVAFEIICKHLESHSPEELSHYKGPKP
ncbi:MAG: hypothetical protein ACE1Y4_03360 [Lysobacterales bacterium]